MFSAYFSLGWHHIASISAYDHLVFIVAMSLGYTIKEWRKLAVLVTAFTAGHSITLVLATFQLIKLPTAIIEFVIPVTILLTALFHLIFKFKSPGKSIYALVLLFGLIHGLGFSNFLTATLSTEESLFVPLLAFNIGLEIGQLLILGVILSLSFLITNLIKYPAKDWYTFLCGLCVGVSLILMLNTKFW